MCKPTWKFPKRTKLKMQNYWISEHRLHSWKLPKLLLGLFYSVNWSKTKSIFPIVIFHFNLLYFAVKTFKMFSFQNSACKIMKKKSALKRLKSRIWVPRKKLSIGMKCSNYGILPTAFRHARLSFRFSPWPTTAWLRKWKSVHHTKKTSTTGASGLRWITEVLSPTNHTILWLNDIAMQHCAVLDILHNIGKAPTFLKNNLTHQKWDISKCVVELSFHFVNYGIAENQRQTWTLKEIDFLSYLLLINVAWQTSLHRLHFKLTADTQMFWSNCSFLIPLKQINV